MEIKVGSEWVNNINNKFTILAIDEDKLFIKYADGEHTIISEEGLRVFCKPLPKRRTVWLNVYNGCCLSYSSKDEADKNKVTGILFQQEVELIDPREGERNGQ